MEQERCASHADYYGKNTDTVMFNTYGFSMATVGTQICLNVTLYIYCLSCFTLKRLSIKEENEHKKIYEPKLQFTATVSMVVIYNTLHRGAP